MSEFEELISKLLEKVPELSRSVIEERINEKKEKVGAGYLTDQGAIFLVAADLGVSLEQTQNAEVAIKDLYIGAKEVTLESRVLNISPTKQFTKKDGSSFSLRTISYSLSKFCSSSLSILLAINVNMELINDLDQQKLNRYPTEG